MTKAHTPAPWRCDFTHSTPEELIQLRKIGMTPVQALTNEGQRFIMSGQGDDTKRVALVDGHARYKRGEGHRSVCPERDANALLIAAAPELLATLIQAVEASGYSLSGPTDSRAAEHGEPAWVCNARAIVAKATN